MIAGGIPTPIPSKAEQRTRKRSWPAIMSIEDKRSREEETIVFSDKDGQGITHPHEDPMVLALKMGTHRVRRVLVDTGSSADILYYGAFIQMGFEVKNLHPIKAPLTGFSGNVVNPLGVITIPVVFGTTPKTIVLPIDFLVVDIQSVYNAIIGLSLIHI